ncbi:MAG TPA: VTT domain-containing protein [Phycisphaerales bacterium]|nr:VTT domain-containing protein [Phycisphaerales bacterium]
MSEYFHQAIEFVTNLPDHLQAFAIAHSVLVYLLVGGIVFCETGLVVCPFLPGDSLLFACGMLAEQGHLSVPALAGVFVLAAFLGDNLNYWLGRALGPRILRGETVPLLNRKNLDRTRAFFARHGGKSVVLARFIPIVRTFAPFTAGVGTMAYPRFLAYSVFGAALWVGVCVTAGWFLGQIPAIKDHFDLAVILIIGVSLIPIIIGALRAHRENVAARKSRAAAVIVKDDKATRDAA